MSVRDISVLSCFFFVLILYHPGSIIADNNGVYIVYMGAAPSRTGSIELTQLLDSLKRKGSTIVHTYRHSFSGFAARLSEEEARSISQRPGVISVFPDPILQLHTTRSWDFLKYQTEVIIDSSRRTNSESASKGSDTIIGIMDTGIWPESESFNDKDMDPIPSRWKGTCMEGSDFSSSKCNRKLIGARFYADPDDATTENHTPRDMLGHGTHVSSTAGGSSVSGVSYYGLAAGTAKGGSLTSRIAMYRVCLIDGCRGSAILAAFDDAIADGVDILSLSLGAAPGFAPDLINDPIAIGSFHAVENGVTVVCSAGNAGPTSETVVNAAPWIITVAASTIDRDFESDVLLGGNKVIKGGGINFSSLNETSIYPLIYGKSAQMDGAEETSARNCNPNTLDAKKIKGKIVLCDSDDNLYSGRIKLEEVKSLGGVGLILIDDEERAVSSNYGTFPMTVVTSKDGTEILSYINSSSNPVATILTTTTVTDYKPAPIVAYFSSRGPSMLTRNIIKPDIAAPGVNILAAWIGNETAGTPGKGSPLYNVISGTSMSCPHVSGIAATVKSQNPSWSPSAIKSALMTTSSQSNNLKSLITTQIGTTATPYDYGAGEVGTSRPMQPGLVYETNTTDYLSFLCYYGYNLNQIKNISRTVPDGFNCPQSSSTDMISTINYPSIAISGFTGKQSKAITRTVTNVGDEATTYSVSVETPDGLTVKVIPENLVFKKNLEKQNYQVIFSSESSLKDDVFGSITWTNGKYKVRSPFVVSSKSSKSEVKIFI